jgi:hypothetical protein
VSASIIRKRHVVLLVALMAVGIGVVAIYQAFAKVKQPPGGSARDLRYEQVGTWNCSGVTTSPHGTERPFYGVLRNEWALDQQWLKINFEEQRPVTDPPLREEQYWGYSESGDQHTRIMLVNDGSYGILKADGAQPHALSWQGPYTLGETTYEAVEATERVSEDRYRWYGSVKQGDTTLVRYEFMCTRA